MEHEFVHCEVWKQFSDVFAEILENYLVVLDLSASVVEGVNSEVTFEEGYTKRPYVEFLTVLLLAFAKDNLWGQIERGT